MLNPNPPAIQDATPATPLVTVEHGGAFVGTEPIINFQDSLTNAFGVVDSGGQIDINVRNIITTTKGDLAGFSNVPVRVPVGADGKVLTANSAVPLGVEWQTPSSGYTSPQHVLEVATANRAYTSIQTAITAAAAGDVVWVWAGTYNENITLKAGVHLHMVDGVILIGKISILTDGIHNVSGRAVVSPAGLLNCLLINTTTSYTVSIEAKKFVSNTIAVDIAKGNVTPNLCNIVLNVDRIEATQQCLITEQNSNQFVNLTLTCVDGIYLTGSVVATSQALGLAGSGIQFISSNIYVRGDRGHGIHTFNSVNLTYHGSIYLGIANTDSAIKNESKANCFYYANVYTVENLAGGIELTCEDADGIVHFEGSLYGLGAIVTRGKLILQNTLIESGSVGNNESIFFDTTVAPVLILDNVTIIATTAGTGKSIRGDAACNVKVYGTTVTNLDKDANVTVQVGTFIYDTNVV